MRPVANSGRILGLQHSRYRAPVVYEVFVALWSDRRVHPLFNPGKFSFFNVVRYRTIWHSPKWFVFHSIVNKWQILERRRRDHFPKIWVVDNFWGNRNALDRRRLLLRDLDDWCDSFSTRMGPHFPWR